MSNEFVCKIDGVSFLTKEEMFTHLSRSHLRIVETEDGLEEIKIKLSQMFPSFLVEVSKDISFMDEERIDFNYGELSTLDLLYVILRPTLFQGTICFAVDKNSVGRRFDKELQIFPSLDDAIAQTQRMLWNITECGEQLTTLAKKYEPQIVTVNLSSCGNYYHDYENSLHVNYSASYADGTLKWYATLTNNFVESDDDPQWRESIQQCLHFTSGQYLDTLEGEVQEESRNYSQYNNSRTYTINGVDIATLVTRAKRMRITIIEEK